MELLQTVSKKLLLTECIIYRRLKRCRLKNRDFTIIASNCVGTIMYRDMHLEYRTPTVNFVHYNDFAEAAEKWERRKKRINWNNIILVGTYRGDCDYEVLKSFDSLPYPNKLVFTNVDYPEFNSAYYIKGFENQETLGDVTSFKPGILKRRYMDDFDYVAFLNRGKI